MRKSAKFIGFLFMAFNLFLTACNSSPGKSQSLSDISVMKVTIAPVKQMNIADTLTIYGTVEFRQESFLESQFEGRLTDFSLMPGDRVAKGQQIGTIIPRDREVLLQLESQFPQRVRPLIVDQIKSVPLYSPIDGVIVEVMRHTGDVIEKGEQIAHIGEDRLLQIKCELPTTYLFATRNLRQMSVTFPNTGFSSLKLPIAAILASVDPQKQTVGMRLDLPNTARNFRPGMLVMITFPDESHPDALIVPPSALIEEEGLYSVFVFKNGKVEKRSAKTGIMLNDRIEILDGLQANESVVIDRAYSLKDGMQVEVQ